MESRPVIVPAKSETLCVIGYATVVRLSRSAWLARAAFYSALSSFGLYGFCAVAPYLIERLGFGNKFGMDIREAASPAMLGVALLEFPIAVIAVVEPEDSTVLAWTAFALSLVFWICALASVVVAR